MEGFEMKLAKYVQSVAKNVVKNSVGKSIFVGVYEKELPSDVKTWIKEQKKK